MVRVGGGWMSLVEFLGKYDPCRGRLLFFLFFEFTTMVGF